MGGVFEFRLRGPIFRVESTVEFPSQRLPSDLPNLVWPGNGLPVDLDSGALESSFCSALCCLGNEQDTSTGSTGTTGSAAAVCIGVGICRHRELNHHPDIRHINPARCDIGGDEDSDASISEGCECAGALSLGQLAAEGEGGEAIFCKALSEVGGFCSALNKYEAATLG
jgi:hypothetical protein